MSYALQEGSRPQVNDYLLAQAVAAHGEYKKSKLQKKGKTSSFFHLTSISRTVPLIPSRMHDDNAKKEISLEAVKLNFANNPGVSHNSIVKELQSKGFHISSKNKQRFSEEELDQYYATVLDFWKDFCSNVYFYSPEGALFKKYLQNLPNDPRYRWAFYR